MKIELAVPHRGQLRGNTVTAERIRRGLERLGEEVRISFFAAGQDGAAAGDGGGPAGEEFSPAVLHGFHAYWFEIYRRRRGPSPVPYAVTLTGTDLNHHLYEPDKRPLVLRCLDGAAAVHVFHEAAARELWREAPSTRGRTHIIAQALEPFPANGGRGGLPAREPGAFVFLLPAGVRRVKQIPFALSTLRELRAVCPAVRLWLAGPVLEADEAARVRALVEANRGWARWLDPLPHHRMGGLYERADAVLNTSLSEGQSSAVLEAMAQGVPVLAADIPGNRSVVADGATGLLFRDKEQFLAQARRLLADGEWRRALAARARAFVRARHSPESEALALRAMYRSISNAAAMRASRP